MVELQIKSNISGVWIIEEVIPGEWYATHEDIDGAEDSYDDRIMHGKTLNNLIENIRAYDEDLIDE
jgi:hypothetical protein